MLWDIIGSGKESEIMIKTVYIKNADDAIQLLTDHPYNENIGRVRSNYLYRGMPDASYKLRTTLERNCIDKQALLEMPILNNFTKYALKDEPGLVTSVWHQMVVGQHYGLPTRLLDWTHSALIALSFATSERDFEKTDKRDGVVWRIDAEELVDLLPEAYRTVLHEDNTEYFSIRTLNRLASTTAQFDSDLQDSAIAILEPPSTDPRIINQYSYFSIIPLAMSDIEGFLEQKTEKTVRYIIDRSIRWDIRDILDQLNVSERIAFPGLEGLSRWVARHYYVKR